MSKLLFTKAENIKLALMLQYRFSRGAHLTATECGAYSSDFLVVEKDGTLVEFEVKVSLSDAKLDFKKNKHTIYEECSRKEKWVDGMQFFPHYFYFALPESIVSSFLPLLIGKPYGVVSIPDIEFVPNINWIRAKKYLKVVKKAQLMRKHIITDEEKIVIMKRMSSELINLRIEKNRQSKKELKNERKIEEHELEDDE